MCSPPAFTTGSYRRGAAGKQSLCRPWIIDARQRAARRLAHLNDSLHQFLCNGLLRLGLVTSCGSSYHPSPCWRIEALALEEVGRISSKCLKRGCLALCTWLVIAFLPPKTFSLQCITHQRRDRSHCIVIVFLFSCTAHCMSWPLENVLDKFPAPNLSF